MFHLVARAVPDTLLWKNTTEARHLWRLICRAHPQLWALCLMPNHLHLMVPRADERALVATMSAFARWRNHRRGESGAVWQPHPPPEPLVDGQKVQRTLRYIHLNPCRARLCADPLAWPWSTHRDAVGLALDPARGLHPDPHAFHEYVSGDPTVSLNGTTLPTGGDPGTGEHGLRAILEATSACARAPIGDLRHKGAQRARLLGITRVLSPESLASIADFHGVSKEAVHKAPAPTPGQVRVVSRALADPRFRALRE